MVIAVALVGLFAGVTRADSAICTDPHCYGIAGWLDTPTFDGAIAYIDTTQLSVGSQCTQLATSELWVGTNYEANPPFSHFVEEGVLHGIHANGACGSGYQWFWASNTGGTYAQHFPSGYPVTLGTTYITKIAYMGTGSISYGAYRNGTLVGSVGTACCTKWLETGGESTTYSVTASGDASTLQKELPDGTWTYDWSGASLQSTGPWVTVWQHVSKEISYSACCVF
jgi:hypothetical protein